MYIATHKQTGQKKAGTFEELQDLDKRIWDLQKFVNPINSEIMKNTPLCTVKIKVYERLPHVQYNSKPVTIIEDIFSHKQFEGTYLGG
jgi:hypothetical protein